MYFAEDYTSDSIDSLHIVTGGTNTMLKPYYA